MKLDIFLILNHQPFNDLMQKWDRYEANKLADFLKEAKKAPPYIMQIAVMAQSTCPR